MTDRKPNPASRTARIFLSSTFRDFGEERDLLVRKVFPGLRARLKDRFVELVDVDLRWGITAEQAERGEVLPICLAEIDRSRPFFVGLLGERYGWVPEKGKYPPELVEQRPWLKKHQGGKSVTELEILHGVLNNPKMARRALFYFRSAAYAKQKGGDYLPQTAEDRTRQKDLKARIRDSGFPVVQGYKDPEALAKRLERDLWKILDEMYPADAVPDAFTRESFRHEAHAVPRRRLYLGGEGYIEALDASLAEGRQRILVEGASGGGKSALIANWLERRAKKYRKELVHVHYLGATAEASNPQALVRRLIEAIKRLTESTEEIPSDPQALYDSLSTWLAIAHAYAVKRKTKVLIVLDALNGLRDLQDLRWFPEFLPERVRMVVSCLPGPVHEALLTKGDWQRVEVTPLDGRQARELFVAYLRRYNKELPKDLLAQALGHPLSTNPLFLRTLAEELRLFGVHEQLKDRLDHYLTSRTVDDLFERVLERVEHDCGTKQVRKAMEGIWESRAGLSEHEIQGFANLKPAEWAPIRHALDDSLLESGGRITFAHDYMRLAVSDRYLKGNNTLPDEGQSPEALKLRRKAHIALAKWFDTRPEEEVRGRRRTKVGARRNIKPQTHPADARSAEEVPWQYQQARDWKALKACLTRRDMFQAVYACRSGQELLSYWLDIETNTKARFEKEYEKAWKAWKPKKTDEATGDLASALASFLNEAGRIRGSLSKDLARFALAIGTQELGEKSRLAIARMLKLSSILDRRGEWSEAELLGRKALDIAEKSADQEMLVSSLHNLALHLAERGKYEYAEQLFRRAISVSQTYQEMSLHVMLNSLGSVLLITGRYDEAEKTFRAALDACEKFRGTDHRDTAMVLRNLGRLIWVWRDNDYDGEKYIRQSMDITRKVLGPSHPDTVKGAASLARMISDRGISGDIKHLEIAEALYRSSAEAIEHGLGPNSIELLSVLEGMAFTLRLRGNLPSSERTYRQALSILKNNDLFGHPSAIRLLGGLGDVLDGVGKVAEAVEMFRSQLNVIENLGQDYVFELRQALYVLGNLLVKIGEIEDALKMLRREVGISEKFLGTEDEDVVDRLTNIGDVLRRSGRFGEAESELLSALKVAEVHDYGGPFFALAELRIDQNRYEEAEQLLQRCLEIRRRKLDPEDEEIAEAIQKLTEVYRLMGRDTEATEVLRQLPAENREAS